MWDSLVFVVEESLASIFAMDSEPKSYPETERFYRTVKAHVLP